MSADHAWTVDAIAHEIDMIVFELEQTPRNDSADGLREERAVLRRRLEALRDRLQDLSRTMS